MAQIFPPESRRYAGGALFGVIGLVAIVAAAITYYGTPKYTRVGYAPLQPVAFSHALHAGGLGMDCRFCHTHVEQSAHSNVPTVGVCRGCHASNLGNVRSESPALEPARRSWETGQALSWVRLHQVPDYAQFNHAAHVSRGVSCVSCHGPINEMEVVYHDQSLAMAWCLACHRDPDASLRPADRVTDLTWTWEAHEAAGGESREAFLAHIRDELAIEIRPPVDCTGCHR